jgi:hypothetical protein
MYIPRRSNTLNTRRSTRATSFSSPDTPKYTLEEAKVSKPFATKHQLARESESCFPLKQSYVVDSFSNHLSWDNDTRDVKTAPREDALKRGRESSDFVSSAQAQVLWGELQADFGALPQLEDPMPYDELEGINAVGVEHYLELTPVNGVISLDHASLEAAKQLYAGSFDYTAHISSDNDTRHDEDVPTDALKRSRESSDFVSCDQAQVLWHELEVDFGALPQPEDPMPYDELEGNVKAHPSFGDGNNAVGVQDYLALAPANDVASLQHASIDAAKQLCAGSSNYTAHTSSESDTRDDEDVPMDDAL